MSSPSRRLCFTLLCLSVAAAAPAQERPSAHAARAAWADVAGRWSGTWQPRFDARTGTFREALGRVRVSAGPLDDAAAVQVGEAVLTVLEPVVGAAPGDLALVYETHPGARHVLQYQQRLFGLPVEASRVELVLMDDGHLLLARSSGVLRAAAPPAPQVTRSDAGDLARLAPPGVSGAVTAWDPRLVWTAGPEPGRPRAQLAWRVHVEDPLRVGGAWSVLIDATTGATREVRSEVVDAVTGTVTCRCVAAGPQGGALEPLPAANLIVTGSDSAAFLTQLTDDLLEQTGAVISGNGAVVVYEQASLVGRQLYAQPVTGGPAVALTSSGDNYRVAIDHVGSQVWFTSTAGGSPDIWTVMTDGSGLTQLTSDPATDDWVALAEGAGELFFHSDRDGDFEVYRSTVAGGALTQITSNDGYDGEPSASDAGTEVALVSDRDGPRDVYVESWGGFGWSPLRVTFGAPDERAPVLTPDGLRLVFESDAPEATGPGGGPSAGGSVPGAGRMFARSATPLSSIWEAQADGSIVRRLTHGESRATQPFTPAGCSSWTERERAGAPSIALLRDDATGVRIPLSAGPGDADGPHVAAGSTVGVFTWDVGGDREVFVFDLGAPGALAAAVTDAAGAYSLDLPDGGSASIDAALTGLHVRVTDLAPGQGELREHASTSTPAAGVDLLFNPTGASELPTAQTTAYVHTDGSHGHLASVFTGPAFGLPLPLPIDFPIEARVNDPAGVANAFYNLARKDMTFFVRGAAKNGAYDTLVAHEYGHAADDAFGGIVSGTGRETRFALSEALGDVLAMSYSGSLVVGEDFFAPGAHIRDYTTDLGDSPSGAANRQWDCDACPSGSDGLPESHAHGAAFAGFGKDLAALVGGPTADELLFGAFVDNPPDSPDAVTAIFLASAGPAFGGTGDPATSPLYEALCKAAARHGFPCWPRPDFGGELCVNMACPGLPALHQAVGTEWLGATVDGLDPGCVLPASDEDGVFMDPFWESGTMIPIDVDFKVDTDLQDSGRYDASVPLRKVYLNAWLFVPGEIGTAVTHIIGTGSPTGTVAYDPTSWPGGEHSDSFLVTAPVVPDDRVAFVRFRLDYGEDAGVLLPTNKLSSPLLAGPCGPALFGEVEDYQIYIFLP